MSILATVLIIIVVAHILSQVRHDRFLRDYLALTARDRRDDDGGGDRDDRLDLYYEYMRRSGLRRGITSLVVGLALVLVALATGATFWGLGFFPDPAAWTAIAWTSPARWLVIIGVILLALGVGHLLSYWLADQRRPPRLPR
ncbi:MAG: hypothetical protein JW819_00750 [Candidatus Krumholzibacteriota bacterium]|nr:hypothetical protein [Candidatus Krumholzibacteriota bacterium]